MGKRYRHISLEERDRIAEMESLGHTVKWTNNGSSEHTATSGDKCKEDKKWDTGALKTGQSFEYAFTEAGTFPYYCKPHCHYGMKGEIIVQ